MSEFTRLILPTRELVTDIAQYDPTFSFLDNGSRTVIEEALLQQSFCNESSYSPEKVRKPGLVGVMCAVYDDYVDDDFYMDTSTGFDQGSKMCNYMSNMAVIELVAGMVEKRIEQIVQSIIATRLFELDSREMRWHNKDLIVALRTLKRAEAKPSNVGRGFLQPTWY